MKQSKRAVRRNSRKSRVDPVQRELASMTAKQQFVTASMSMGWQLAGTVIIPIIIGLKLDDYFDTSPSFTLAALVIATCGSISVVSSTIKRVNREMSEIDNKEKKRAK